MRGGHGRQLWRPRRRSPGKGKAGVAISADNQVGLCAASGRASEHQRGSWGVFRQIIDRQVASDPRCECSRFVNVIEIFDGHRQTFGGQPVDAVSGADQPLAFVHFVLMIHAATLPVLAGAIGRLDQRDRGDFEGRGVCPVARVWYDMLDRIDFAAVPAIGAFKMIGENKALFRLRPVSAGAP